MPLNGRDVALADIACPVLNVLGGRDTLVTPASSAPLLQALHGAEVDTLTLPAGRAGLFVGREARKAAAWRGPGRLRQIQTPTTIMHGNRDGLIPVGNGARLDELIPAARYIELADVRHLIPYEAPEVFAHVIEECPTRGGGAPTQ